MPRPDRSAERRAELIPEVAATFAEQGYRRATTAELARRCGVQETILYRLWPDKKAMFLDAIEHVFTHSVRSWDALLTGHGGGDAAERLLEHEASHHGEKHLYRIVFAGLSETDDEDVRSALRRMYRGFHRFVRERLAEHAPRRPGAPSVDPTLVAWAFIGVGTMANVGRELGVLGAPTRKRLFSELGRALLDLGAG